MIPAITSREHQELSALVNRVAARDENAVQKLNAIVNRAIDGDNNAFNQVFAIFFDIANMYSYRLPIYVQEEFLQDMVERLSTCIIDKKWQDQGKPFTAWIHGTADNAIQEWRRKIKKHSPEIQDPEFPYADIEDTDLSILDQMLQQEEKAILWNLVMQLPEIQAIVIYEHYAHNRPFSEISELIGRPEATCRKIKQRALESLRQLIHNSGYYPEKE